MTLIRLLLLTALLAPAALAQTWAVQPTPTTADLNDVFARSATEVYATGDLGVLLRTTNAGATWNQTALGGFDLEGVAFNPAGTVGVIATDDGPVFRSTDGVSWTLVQTGSVDNLRNVSWASNTVVWSVGREGDALRSTNAGQTWSVGSIPNIDRMRAIAGVSATAAIAVGESGQAFRTTDGGATWTSLAVGTGADLKDIQMVTATTGYIAGSNNTLLKTTNGGTTWTNVSGGFVNGNGLHFVDVNTGWVVNNGGQIFFTSNGGATWTTQPSGTGVNLNSVHFASATRGWAVGDVGVVTAFTAGGGGGLTVTAVPVSPPVVIPGGGGSFQYRVTLSNTGSQPVTFQAWTAVTGPVSREPVVGPQTVTLPAGATVTKTLTQQVPGNAPAGTYTYIVKAGTFPGTVIASNSFTFTKSATPLAGGEPVEAGSWAADGTFGDAVTAAAEAAPAGLALSEAHPNPFSSQARLTLSVNEAQRVRVEAFDALGRRVAVLLDGEVAAGTHALALDASALPAGLYVVRATGETATATRRALLAR